MTEALARKALVEAGKRLLAEGLVARSWGNLSIRLDDETMAITPSGIPYAEVEEGMIVIVNIETGAWSGDWKPSGERKVHREIYRRRQDAKAIVHTHQNAASACAAARTAVPLPEGAVPCAAYALPGTKALTRAAADALGSSGTAVLLANHGVFTIGASLDQAFERVRDLESACAAYLDSRAEKMLPAPADLLWNPDWIAPLKLADGSSVLLSTAPYTLAWADRAKPLRASLDDLAQLVGPRVRSAQRLPDHRPAEEALFVRELGLLALGTDAEAVAMVVEKAARAAIGAASLGGAKPIPAIEAGLMRFVYKRSYAKLASRVSPSSSG